MTTISRRAFVHGACTAACVCVGVSTSNEARAASGEPRYLCETLPYSDVRLGDGPMLRQFQAQQSLFLGIDDDALLKPFRQRAGQPAPGADMGGWYDDSRDFHIDPKDWSTANWHGFIPGHSFGQYVSGLARGHAATRDYATRRKIAALVSKYAATISSKFFTDYPLPTYTYDKLAIGLIDAHRFAKVPEASAALDRLTDAALPFFPERALTREERRERPYTSEAQIWDEPYTLPENLYLATSAGMGARYRTLAGRYLQDEKLFDPLAEARSPLQGKHAYSHVNALSSAMSAYLDGGNDKYLRAARNGFEFVLAQSYATGGWGPNEELLAADDTETLFDMLGSTHRSFETPCGAYGHFKIARSLLQLTGEAKYGDSMERLLYNTILGALPTKPNGDTFYYSDYNARATKFYRGEAWPCCSGTFAQLTADYGISSYLLKGKTLLVNLYAPSSARFVIDDVPVTVTQTGDYPVGNRVRLKIEAPRAVSFGLALRIPGWAGPATALKRNGKAEQSPIVPGTFAGAKGPWSPGEEIELVLDQRPRLEPLNAAHPEMVALMYGPLALFPVGAPDAPLTREHLLGARRHAPDEWRVTTGKGEIRLKPFIAIRNETYRLYSRLA